MADDDDDPQLRSMRAAWRSLPDEDPPERGLAELMAAARRQASVMAETRTPWWRRAVHALLRPPILALATVLVLLGGLFVVTSTHKGVSPEPTPVEESPAPAAAPAADHGAATGAAFGSASAPAVPETAAPEPEPAPSAVAPPKSPAHHATSAPKRSAPAKAEQKPSVIDSLESPSPSPPPPPPAPAMAPVAPRGAAAADDSSGEGDNETRAPVAKKAKADDAPPRKQLDAQLLTQARAAATRGDCEAAKRIAQRIASDDPGYYSDNVASDPVLAKCLGK